MKINLITTVQDWADEKLRHLCGRITPGKRLAVVLVMFLFFGGMSIYITVSSIYNMGKRDGEQLHIEHLGRLPMEAKDSINQLKIQNDARNTEE
ncbi:MULTISPECIES: TraL conjugative transposon family protein [Bacteroides]|uniref:TraL conjugative transposon family protein n=1 Tax=Bacteroides TaxID=816 RepID=UPI001897D689|nr:TraL conjugative transposon family protein [Bacteroides fragilis]